MEKLGANAITLFNMGEIIREALVYIDPNQNKEEAVDPKAAKQKAKAPEATPTDKYAGQDTTKYKELAEHLLKQIQLTTGNDKELPGKDADFVSLVSDDTALVQLFIQKLKLTFKAEAQS